MKFSIAICGILSILLMMSLKYATANTPVSGNVSGQWTTAGSPYLVQGNINVAAGQTLSIQPGVEVIFEGFYRFTVNGQLRAIGNSSSPIVFKMNDTTGWHNDISQSGGWRGIQYNPFGGGGTDSSELSYCTIQDVKHGINGTVNGINALNVTYRSLKVSYCIFRHNQSSANQSDGKIINVTLQATQHFDMQHCEIYDSKVRIAVVFINGPATISRNTLHHNTGGSTFWSILSELLFADNEVHHNTHTFDMTAVKVDGGHNTLANNRIHHNTADRMGAITCTMGKTIIESNFISNNNTLQGNCGPTDGGGGIHLSHNNNGIWDSTQYIVRNNIIANNYCAFNGGGIYIYDCKAHIVNNHIINNSTQFAGPGLYNIGSQSKLFIKNNLFYGNGNNGLVQQPQIYFLSSHSIWFDYNFIQHPFYQSVLMNLPPTLLGDTSHNQIASNPFLQNPTLSNHYQEDALPHNFSITPLSLQCINQGDTTGVHFSATDYIGNIRVQGQNIDIGAYETNIESPLAIELSYDNQVIKIYPNPTQNQLHIYSDTQAPMSYSILTPQGNTIESQPLDLTQKTISVQHLVRGMYLLQLSSKQGITKIPFVKY